MTKVIGPSPFDSATIRVPSCDRSVVVVMARRSLVSKAPIWVLLMFDAFLRNVLGDIPGPAGRPAGPAMPEP